jgi:hypothetical protein
MLNRMSKRISCLLLVTPLLFTTALPAVAGNFQTIRPDKSTIKLLGDDQPSLSVDYSGATPVEITQQDAPYLRGVALNICKKVDPNVDRTITIASTVWGSTYADEGPFGARVLHVTEVKVFNFPTNLKQKLKYHPTLVVECYFRPVAGWTHFKVYAGQSFNLNNDSDNPAVRLTKLMDAGTNTL